MQYWSKWRRRWKGRTATEIATVRNLGRKLHTVSVPFVHLLFFFFFSFLLQRCSVVKSLIELAYANIFFSSIIHLEILFDSSAYPYIIRVFLRVQYGQVEECDRMTRAKRAYIRNEACSPCLVCMKERKLIGTVNEHVC